MDQVRHRIGGVFAVDPGGEVGDTDQQVPALPDVIGQKLEDGGRHGVPAHVDEGLVAGQVGETALGIDVDDIGLPEG